MLVWMCGGVATLVREVLGVTEGHVLRLVGIRRSRDVIWICLLYTLKIRWWRNVPFLDHQLLLIFCMVFDVVLNVCHEAEPLHVFCEVKRLVGRRLGVLLSSSWIAGGFASSNTGRPRWRRSASRRSPQFELLATCSCRWRRPVLGHEGTRLLFLVRALFAHERLDQILG